MPDPARDWASHLDTATLPAPDVVRSRRDDRPGCEWRPAQGWRVLTAGGDPADAGAGCVYLDHTCDDMASGWGIPGDWEAMRIEDARRLALSLLAAADRAERVLVELEGGTAAPLQLPAGPSCAATGLDGPTGWIGTDITREETTRAS